MVTFRGLSMLPPRNMSCDLVLAILNFFFSQTWRTSIKRMIYTNNTVLYVITILFIPDKWLLKACYHQGDISGVTKIGKYAFWCHPAWQSLKKKRKKVRIFTYLSKYMLNVDCIVPKCIQSPSFSVTTKHKVQTHAC